MDDRKTEVVISGIGGSFPECDNAEELSELLFNKTNGITINSRRWTPNYLGAISGTGKMKNIDSFDATFFGVNNLLATVMDPMTRIMAERSIEAIMDAGLSLSDVSGTNIGVFVGSAIGETEISILDSTFKNSSQYILLGQSRTMQANRISNMLNLTGPSFAMNGGWICGANGLHKAKQMMEDGHISAAIVGTISLVLTPELQFQWQGLNKLNKNDQTKPFSSNADGYNRSESCVVLFLQRASEAKRSYGTLLNVKSMVFGNQQSPLTNHVKDDFKSLLSDTYKEANVDPTTVEYVEAYGSGVKCEDRMELNVMDEVFCTERRKTPLKVGSIKSNIGHCEAAAFFVSIVKSIIIFECGYIPPNIHFDGPNENIPALQSGKIRIVTEKAPFVEDIIGVSGFGTTNAFCHVILRRNNSFKKCSKSAVNSYIPQIILVSGRNEKNTIGAMQKIKSRGNDKEFIALANNVFGQSINTHFYRSFSILPNSDESQVDAATNFSTQKRPVWFMFSGMGSQWQGMGKDLMKIPIFANAIHKCDLVLRPRGLCIETILTSKDPKIFDNILHSFVGITAVQIGLIDILRALDIIPDGIVGHSLGETASAYADGCFTTEETILSAYARGRSSLDAKLIPGMMAAVGLGHEEIKNQIPHDIDVACHNSATSCTLSGPKDSINDFISTLVAKGVFAKVVNVSGIAFHSRYIQSIGPILLKHLKEIIREPKLRSLKWISTSLPETEWNSELGKYSSAEYHTNNTLNSVLFEESLKHIPGDAIVIEIAPHGLLQAIVKRALPDTVTNIPLTKIMCEDSIQYFLNAVGKLYTSGLNPKVQILYPIVTFPVSRGTPFIHSLPLWEHNNKWEVMPINRIKYLGFSDKFSFILNDKIHLTEYQIHDQFIVPTAYVLIHVWNLFIQMHIKIFSENPIRFHAIKCINNFKIHPTNFTECHLLIQPGSGLFELNLNDKTICSGQIQFLQDNELNEIPENSINIDLMDEYVQESSLKEEIYSILEDNGYHLGDNYKNILKFNVHKNNIQGCVTWKNDWIYFLDGLLKFPLLENLTENCMVAPISIRDIIINPKIFEQSIKRDVFVNYNKTTNEITCNGVKISGIRNEPIELGNVEVVVGKLEEQTFIQYNQSICKNIDDFIYDSLDVITELDKFNFFANTGKLIICTLNTFDDHMCNVCSKVINQITENQLSIDSLIMNWDNVRDVSEDDESGKFIAITNWNNLQYTTKSLAGKACCYIIVCSEQKCQDFNDWKIIIQQQFNGKIYLTLIKKCLQKITNYENSIFIKSSNEGNDLSIWKALEKHRSSNELIYIISKSEPLKDITIHVKNILVKYQSSKLRFVFIFDSNAPEIESNKLFYTNQLHKGLLVNIYKNGGWGYYKMIFFQDLKINKEVANIPVLEEISKNSNNELTVKYLGFNFEEALTETHSKDEFEQFEYSALSKGNKRVMGIMSFNKTTHQIKYDEILGWPVPTKWQLEDAATVPLAYALNYYMFKVLCSLKKDKTILVTFGLHPVGQAAIAIGLAEKCDVYVIVESTQQSKQLSNIFPKLSSSRIFINVDNKFDIQVKLLRKTEGIDLIINFLSGEAFHCALNILAKNGQFFHFSKSDIKNQENLGMRIFLKKTSFYVVNSNLLINESDKNKEIVKRAFSEGLKEGIVKPFQKNILETPISSGKMVEALRTSSVSKIFEKVIVSLNNDYSIKDSQKVLKCNKYQSHPDHIYVIFGNKSDWLVLVEWLVKRGARKITILLKELFISSIDCKRLNTFISFKVSIQLESETYLNSREESLNLLNRLTSRHTLNSIFIINQLDDSKINNLEYAVDKLSNKSKTTSFVCISSKGKNACEKLKSIGLNALYIRCNKILSKSNNTTLNMLLPALDMLLQKPNNDESFSFVFSEKITNKLEESRETNDVIANFFPESTEELLHLHEKITKEAEFVEVPSQSPRLSQLKSVIPVFVIPGFRPNLVKTLCKQLFYPTFVAQYPENIGSVDELSDTLVNKLESITNLGYVSLVGESWGGIVALKMAQILEDRDTLVSVSLLEGNPEDLMDWSTTFLSNNNYVNKLYTKYSSSFGEFSKSTVEKGDTSDLQLIKVTPHQQILKENTRTTLNWIRSYLQILLESKPFKNKLLTKVTVLKYERKSKFKVIRLSDYCNNIPSVKIIPKTNYEQMLTDVKTNKTLNKNMAYEYINGTELSLSDKYKHFYYNISKE